MALEEHSFRHLLPTSSSPRARRSCSRWTSRCRTARVRQRGSVAVVMESPADNQQPYRVRFADGQAVEAYFRELAMRRKEVEDAAGADRTRTCGRTSSTAARSARAPSAWPARIPTTTCAASTCRRPGCTGRCSSCPSNWSSPTTATTRSTGSWRSSSSWRSRPTRTCWRRCGRRWCCTPTRSASGCATCARRSCRGTCTRRTPATC